MKRAFDLIISLTLLLILIIPIVIISIIIYFTTKDSVIFYSKRYGKNEIFFWMPKFRTMNLNTPDLPTHLLKEHNKYITQVGIFLRKYSLDELPQIFTVISGKMSLVGPRPALHNQNDLIALRRQKNINNLCPGITGLAQISGRDSLTIYEKVEFEYEYLLKKSIIFDSYILFKTFFKVLKIKDISH